MERKLDRSLADLGVKMSVINLAIAGATAFESMGILRRFGHELKPDLLLGYSGPNSIAQFAPNFFGIACGSVFGNFLNHTFIQPAWVRALGEHFPMLFYQSGLANYIKRTFYAGEYRDEAERQCLTDLGVDTAGGGGDSFLPFTATPEFLASLKV